jgi:hypothetical protein
MQTGWFSAEMENQLDSLRAMGEKRQMKKPVSLQHDKAVPHTARQPQTLAGKCYDPSPTTQSGIVTLRVLKHQTKGQHCEKDDAV